MPPNRLLEAGSRPPRGGRGLKLPDDWLHVADLSRPPRGGRGLKYGARPNGARKVSCRPPRGGRGLKLLRCIPLTRLSVSSPSRGTWIEILCRHLFHLVDYVVPLAGDVD